jgi:hypothetical protein
MTTLASSIARMKRLLPASLIAAGFALGAIGAPAIAHADRTKDVTQYFECLTDHSPDGQVDDVTNETCCILHNGKMVDGHCDLILESAQQAPTVVSQVHGRISDLDTAPALTTVPTKAPTASPRR